MARSDWRKPFALLALKALGGLLLPTSALALDNYRAVYDVEIRGVSAGKMVLESVTTDKTYRLNATTTPSMAAKMLGYGEIRERVVGRLHDGQVTPENYERVMAGNDEYLLSYQYDNKAKKANIVKGKSALTLDYIDGKQALDILSLVTQALLDEERGHVPKSYSLLSEDKLRTYQIRALKTETWREKGGKTTEVKVYEQINGKRKTLVYMAHNPLRLAKLQQLRDNDVRFSLKLLDYQAR